MSDQTMKDLAAYCKNEAERIGKECGVSREDMDFITAGTDDIFSQFAPLARAIELSRPLTTITHTDDLGKVVCLDCGWQGSGFELKAPACPVCDGRCAYV